MFFMSNELGIMAKFGLGSIYDGFRVSNKNENVYDSCFLRELFNFASMTWWWTGRAA